MFKAVCKEEIWHIPQEKIELLVFEKIVLMLLTKIKVLSENLRERVKKRHLPNQKGLVIRITCLQHIKSISVSKWLPCRPNYNKGPYENNIYDVVLAQGVLPGEHRAKILKS